MNFLANDRCTENDRCTVSPERVLVAYSSSEAEPEAAAGGHADACSSKRRRKAIVPLKSSSLRAPQYIEAGLSALSTRVRTGQNDVPESDWSNNMPDRLRSSGVSKKGCSVEPHRGLCSMYFDEEEVEEGAVQRPSYPRSSCPPASSPKLSTPQATSSYSPLETIWCTKVDSRGDVLLPVQQQAFSRWDITDLRKFVQSPPESELAAGGTGGAGAQNISEPHTLHPGVCRHPAAICEIAAASCSKACAEHEPMAHRHASTEKPLHSADDKHSQEEQTASNAGKIQQQTAQKNQAALRGASILQRMNKLLSRNTDNKGNICAHDNDPFCVSGIECAQEGDEFMPARQNGPIIMADRLSSNSDLKLTSKGTPDAKDPSLQVTFVSDLKKQYTLSGAPRVCVAEMMGKRVQISEAALASIFNSKSHGTGWRHAKTNIERSHRRGHIVSASTGTSLSQESGSKGWRHAHIVSAVYRNAGGNIDSYVLLLTDHDSDAKANLYDTVDPCEEDELVTLPAHVIHDGLLCRTVSIDADLKDEVDAKYEQQHQMRLARSAKRELASMPHSDDKHMTDDAGSETKRGLVAGQAKQKVMLVCPLASYITDDFSLDPISPKCKNMSKVMASAASDSTGTGMVATSGARNAALNALPSCSPPAVSPELSSSDTMLNGNTTASVLLGDPIDAWHRGTLKIQATRLRADSKEEVMPGFIVCGQDTDGAGLEPGMQGMRGGSTTQRSTTFSLPSTKGNINNISCMPNVSRECQQATWGTVGLNLSLSTTSMPSDGCQISAFQVQRSRMNDSEGAASGCPGARKRFIWTPPSDGGREIKKVRDSQLKELEIIFVGSEDEVRHKAVSGAMCSNGPPGVTAVTAFAAAMNKNTGLCKIGRYTGPKKYRNKLQWASALGYLNGTVQQKESTLQQRESTMTTQLQGVGLAAKGKTMIAMASYNQDGGGLRLLGPCRCKKSRCLRQYCVCFRAGNLCTDGCMCEDCRNDGKHEVMRVAAVQRPSLTALSSSCRCKNSGCIKKYCECYAAQILCTIDCMCRDCHNGKGAREPDGRQGPARICPYQESLTNARSGPASAFAFAFLEKSVK